MIIVISSLDGGSKYSFRWSDVDFLLLRLPMEIRDDSFTYQRLVQGELELTRPK